MNKLFLLIVLCVFLFTSYATSVEIFCTFDTFDPNWSADVSFTSPSPTNQSWQEVDNDTMQIHVSNTLGETMNVSFYWSDHTLIDYNDSATNDTTVSINSGTTYTHYQQYDWYVNVSSASFENQSAIYWFKGEAFDWDINRDQYVNDTDLTLLHSSYLQTTSNRNDITGDGKVNYLDRSRLQHHWGDDYT